MAALSDGPVFAYAARVAATGTIMEKPHAPSTEKNREPILAVLREHFSPYAVTGSDGTWSLDLPAGSVSLTALIRAVTPTKLTCFTKSAENFSLVKRASNHVIRMEVKSARYLKRNR